MAMIDYGALLRVDGKLINRNMDLFMKAADTGYVCEEAVDKFGYTTRICGNYYVYAGDKEFLLVFSTRHYKVISNGKVLYEHWYMPFTSETRYFEGLPAVKVSRLSPEYEIVFGDIDDDYEWLRPLFKGKHRADRGIRRLHKKRYKTLRGHGDEGYKARPFRFLVEWEYAGRKYEVIFGYGIDTSETVWNGIKYSAYNFRQDEIDLINEWFEAD